MVSFALQPVSRLTRCLASYCALHAAEPRIIGPTIAFNCDTFMPLTCQLHEGAAFGTRAPPAPD